MLEQAQHVVLATMFSVSRNSSKASLRAIASVTSMEQRWSELNFKWSLRIKSTNEEFLVYHAMKASQQRGLKRSCFLNVDKNELAKRYRDETIWKGIIPATGKEVEKIYKQIRRKSRADDRSKLFNNTKEMQLIENVPFLTAKRLDSFATRGGRRLATLFVLKKLFGKPVLCRRCGIGNATTKHAAECYGEAPWRLWIEGKNYEALVEIELMLQSTKAFKLRNWNKMIARERLNSGGLGHSRITESGNSRMDN